MRSVTCEASNPGSAQLRCRCRSDPTKLVWCTPQARLNTYDTRPATTLPRRLLEIALDADIVTLGSPTAVYAWIDAVGTEVAQSIPVAAIGRVTHMATKSYALDCVYPENPGITGWA